MPKFKYRNKHRNSRSIVKDNSFTEIALTKMAKKQLTITLCSIFGVTLLTIGSAFSIFTTQAVGEDQVIKVGALNIDFGADADGTLSLTGNYPMEDAEGQATSPYTFTITNTGDIEADYTVKLEDDTEMIDQEACTNNLIDKNQVKYSIDAGTPGVLGSLASKRNVIDQGTLASGASKTYNIRLWIKNDAPNTVLNRHYHGKIVVEGVEKGKGPKPSAVETLLANYTNGEEVQDYDANYTKEDSSAKENKMYVFDHKNNKGTQQSDWTDDELKDYRYIGADPNNYVTFNNEVAGWRIIGIETVDDGTGKKEKRIKLIRKDLLPVGTDNYLSWDNKPSGTGSSEDDAGSNDWTDSRLMYLLNPNHESETTGVSGSIYWNRQSGNCPTGRNNATTTCDFSEVGLLPEAQAMIGDAKWYLGGNSTGNGVLTEAYYKFERGETVYQSSSHPRKTNWTGKVGLMYPSDYGYATSGGTTANRATCLAKELYHWNSSDGGILDCKTNDWLYNSSKDQWTIAPYSGISYHVFHVLTPGYVDCNGAYSSYGVRPVVYLVPDIKLLKGTGSETDPFEFT